jgi:NitT/TauT family transport system substrate-binding protein
MVYLPLTIAERKGFFKEAGLDVEIVDVEGGSKALQALIGGSVDVTSGSFDHTIQMQAKNQSIEGVVLFARDPGIVLAVAKAKADQYKGPQDLKGMTIGVTSPGSQTHFMLNHILVSNGLEPSDVSIVGIGGGPAAVAAVRNGRVDALSNADPVITELQSAGDIKVVDDTRTSAGSKQVFGADYPSGTIYLKTDFIAANPNTVQAIANAMVKALKWMATATPDEIADTVPAEWTKARRELYVASVKNSKEMYSLDGRFNRLGAEVAVHVLSAFDPSVKAAKIDLEKTYTNAFVDKAASAN